MKRKFSNKIILLFATAFLFVAQACTETPTDSENTGKLKLLITDAPFPVDVFDSILVTISKVEMLKLSDSTCVDTISPENCESQRIDLGIETTQINILELQNGVTALLSETEIPTGTYKMMNLYISYLKIFTKTGDTISQKINNEQARIKILFRKKLVITGEQEQQLLLDFDIKRSFKLQGNLKSKGGIKGVNFHPVIHAIPLAEASEIRGTVTDAAGNKLPNATILLIQKNDTITSTFSNEEGYFAILGVLPDKYTVTCEIEGYDLEKVGINVKKGNMESVDFVLKSAN